MEKYKENLFSDKVTIDENAGEIIKHFFKVFKKDVPELLEKSIETFNNNKTPENQNILKLELCKAFSDFKIAGYEKAFDFLNQRTSDIVLEMQFKIDFEDAIRDVKDDTKK